MPNATRRGAGRVSRQDAATGQSALAAILDTEKLHPVMGAIVREANRRGVTLAQLAAATDRDPDSLKRSFRTKRPQLATIEALASALDLPPVTARALLGVLTERDEWELRSEVVSEAMRRAAMFTEPVSVSKALADALAAGPDTRRREALAAFQVARSGLSDDETLRASAVAPALVAVCKALNVDLKSFVASEEILETRILEGAAALEWLLQSLPLSERDKDTLETLAARYNVDPWRLTFRGALNRAVNEFRRAIGHEYNYSDAIADFMNKLKKEAK
jgi:hypothetical protein